MLRHSKFVKDLADDYSLSVRQIEAEWKIAEKELNFDILMNPSKYSHLKVLDGSKSEEVARRLKANLVSPEEASKEAQDVLGVEEVNNSENIEAEEAQPELPELDDEASAEDEVSDTEKQS